MIIDLLSYSIKTLVILSLLLIVKCFIVSILHSSFVYSSTHLLISQTLKLTNITNINIYHIINKYKTLYFHS
ncbi:ORF MSV109 hypothetical protein [Melanoplus sanguinipes entomopoxvirus]|uniref:Uncharacterized protein n=1 Tax=Melanoplus sanguinipes entomopoxvirus TaxID=83191 RepID=Q9YVY2_MSEPV|nr:ORF MSV109 hypothetical protein [Melanoplus sanguinipes entomopoxvirus]AAC97655.1 ORF MSV109 hypothetical protein [Melanoplus sanguinipes entomopoxvirus 'O']